MEDTPKNEANENQNDRRQVLGQLNDIIIGAQVEEDKLERQIDAYEKESIEHEQSVLFDISANIPGLFEDIETIMENNADKSFLDTAVVIAEFQLEHADIIDQVSNVLLGHIEQKLTMLNDIACATDEDMKDLGPSKRHIQADILESDIYSPEQKSAILAFIDAYITGEGVNTADPDSVLQAMTEKDSLEEEGELMRNKRTDTMNAVKTELEKYELEKQDPELQFLRLQLGINVDTDMDSEELLKRVTRSATALGINEEDMKQIIENIRSRS